MNFQIPDLYLRKRLILVVFYLFYLDSACQQLNREHRCYILDPYCPPNAYEKTNDNLITLSIVGVFLSVAILVMVLSSLLFYLRKRTRQSRGMLILKYSQKVEKKSEKHSYVANSGKFIKLSFVSDIIFCILNDLMVKNIYF